VRFPPSSLVKQISININIAIMMAVQELKNLQNCPETGKQSPDTHSLCGFVYREQDALTIARIHQSKRTNEKNNVCHQLNN
jgi:hypothetical protein